MKPHHVSPHPFALSCTYLSVNHFHSTGNGRAVPMEYEAPDVIPYKHFPGLSISSRIFMHHPISTIDQIAKALPTRKWLTWTWYTVLVGWLKLLHAVVDASASFAHHFFKRPPFIETANHTVMCLSESTPTSPFSVRAIH